MTKRDIFALDGLPNQLAAASERKLNQYSEKQLLALLLANIAFETGAPTGKNIDVTLSLDTSAYTANDVLAATQAVAGALKTEGSVSILQSLQLTDKDDNTAADIDLVFLSENVSLGAENGAPDITDANAAKILGIVKVPSANFVDVGGAKIATVNNIGLQLSAPTGTTVYLAAICRGTPTQTASGITLNLGIRQD